MIDSARFALSLALGFVLLLPANLAAAQTPETENDRELRFLRLYHYREAGAIAKALQPKNSRIEVRAVGPDGLVIEAPRTEGDLGDALRRVILEIDLPRPQIAMRFFSSQMNTKGDDSGLSKDLGEGHELLRARVRELSTEMQNAVRRGVWYLSDKIRCCQQREPPLLGKVRPADCELCRPEDDAKSAAGEPGVDDEAALFRSYIADPLDPPNQHGRYTLGYRDAFSPFPASLGRLLLLLAAIDHPTNDVEELIRVMENDLQGNRLAAVCDAGPNRDAEPLVFRQFGPLLRSLLEKGKGRRLRAALADYLFHYKWLRAHRDDVVLYDVRRSADTLDSLFGTIVAAFNADMEVCMDRAMRRPPWVLTEREQQNLRREEDKLKKQIQELEAKLDGGQLSDKEREKASNHRDQLKAERKRRKEERKRQEKQTKKIGKRVDYASKGLVAVATLSGTPAKVEGAAQHYFDFKKPITLGDTFEAAKEALEDDDDGLDLLDLLKNDPKVAAGTVAFGILKAAADPEKRTVSIGAGTRIEVTPRALSSASSAELEVKLEIGEREPPKETKGKETKAAEIDRVLRHTVEDTVRVESLKLFELSSFAQAQRFGGSGCWAPAIWDLAFRRDITRCPYPLVGHAWDLLFGWYTSGFNKFMVKMASIEVGPKAKLSQSSVIVSALVVPTAADIGLTIKFDGDRNANWEKISGEKELACVLGFSEPRVSSCSEKDDEEEKKKCEARMNKLQAEINKLVAAKKPSEKAQLRGDACATAREYDLVMNPGDPPTVREYHKQMVRTLMGIESPSPPKRFNLLGPNEAEAR